MNSLSVKVSLRGERGRRNKSIRKGKKVPAVVYGPGSGNISLSLDIKDAEKYSRKEYENKIFTFESEDSKLKGLKVIKKAVSFHKTAPRPLHIDFLSLDMSKPIRVPVDVKFSGAPKGVKEEGGVFSVSLRNVEIECLPGDIPPAIELDVSHLTLNQSLHVADLKLTDKIKLITKGHRTICSVGEAVKEEEKPSPAEEAKAADEKGAKTEAKKAPAPAGKS